MSEWRSAKELPPKSNNSTSITVIVKKDTKKTMRAYYVFPLKKWIIPDNGQAIPRKRVVQWRTIDRKDLLK